MVLFSIDGIYSYTGKASSRYSFLYGGNIGDDLLDKKHVPSLNPNGAKDPHVTYQISKHGYIKLENEILKNIDLKNNFLKYIYNFDKSKDYYNYSINGNMIRIFARNKIDKSITLKPDLVNFICYVINDIVNTVLNKSIQLLIYMNKKLLKPDIIKFVVSHEFTDTFFKDLEIYMDKIQELKITQENSKKEDEKELEGDDD